MKIEAVREAGASPARSESGEVLREESTERREETDRVQCCRARKAREGAAGFHKGAPEGFDQSSHHAGEEAALGFGGLRAGSG